MAKPGDSPTAAQLRAAVGAQAWPNDLLGGPAWPNGLLGAAAARRGGPPSRVRHSSGRYWRSQEGIGLPYRRRLEAEPLEEPDVHFPRRPEAVVRRFRVLAGPLKPFRFEDVRKRDPQRRGAVDKVPKRRIRQLAALKPPVAAQRHSDVRGKRLLRGIAPVANLREPRRELGPGVIARWHGGNLLSSARPTTASSLSPSPHRQAGKADPALIADAACARYRRGVVPLGFRFDTGAVVVGGVAHRAGCVLLPDALPPRSVLLDVGGVYWSKRSLPSGVPALRAVV